MAVFLLTYLFNIVFYGAIAGVFAWAVVNKLYGAPTWKQVIPITMAVCALTELQWLPAIDKAEIVVIVGNERLAELIGYSNRLQDLATIDPFAVILWGLQGVIGFLIARVTIGRHHT